ncbi:hypothetical protein ACJJTC_002046, partial [Scirpophaga incertulas]
MLEEGSRDLNKRAYCKNDLAFAEDTKCCFTTKRSLDDSRFFCCRCAHKRRSSPLTCLAICFLVLTYNLLGGFLFLAIEGNIPTEETAVAASKPNLSQAQSNSNDLRSKTVERLWSITEDLNILYKENWTKLAAKELMDFQKVLIKTIRGGASLESRISFDHEGDYRWTFSSSFLYALTLITTIDDEEYENAEGQMETATNDNSCNDIREYNNSTTEEIQPQEDSASTSSEQPNRRYPVRTRNEPE